MERRTFIGAAAALTLIPVAARAASASEAEALKQRIIEWYRAFGNPRVDRDYYRSFMTDDYMLLENGELLDVAGDMALWGRLRRIMSAPTVSIFAISGLKAIMPIWSTSLTPR